MLIAFLGLKVRSGTRKTVQMTQVQTGERKRTRKLLLQHYLCPLSVLTGAERLPTQLHLGVHALFGVQNGS